MFDKGNVVFFDIDTQVDFMSPKGALYVPGAKDIIKNLKKLIDYARRNRIVIVATADAHMSDDPEFKAFPPHCVKGTKGQDKIEATKQKSPFIIKIDYVGEIPADKDEYIIEKQTYSFFANPKADELLKKLNKSQAVVFGVATDYCVKAAVEGLLKRGWQVFLVKDAIKEISSDEAERLFEDWKKRGVKLVNTSGITTI